MLFLTYLKGKACTICDGQDFLSMRGYSGFGKVEKNYSETLSIPIANRSDPPQRLSLHIDRWMSKIEKTVR